MRHVSCYEWWSSGVGISRKKFHFCFSLSLRLLSFPKQKAMAILSSRGLLSAKWRRFYRWVSATKGNRDVSIGGCHRPRKTPTSRSIGGSLRRVSTASLAAEVNRKGGLMKRHEPGLIKRREVGTM